MKGNWFLLSQLGSMKEQEQAELNIFKVTENIFSGILDIASLFTNRAISYRVDKEEMKK